MDGRDDKLPVGVGQAEAVMGLCPSLSGAFMIKCLPKEAGFWLEQVL